MEPFEKLKSSKQLINFLAIISSSGYFVALLLGSVGTGVFQSCPLKPPLSWLVTAVPKQTAVK
jgi:hypothetical protein